MPEEKSRQILQKMWDKVAKPAADGKKYIIIKDRKDLEYHFWSGFVDDDQYTLQQWVDAFKDSLLPNGAYLVNETQWMEKAVYHYSGPIDRPYDPMTLREGEWDEKELDQFAWEKLRPCLYFSKEDFGRWLLEAKKSFYVNGKYVVTALVKKELLEFVNAYASPRRILQLGVWRLKAAQGQPAGSPVGADSGFARGPSQSQSIASKLSQLVGARDKK